MRRSVSHMLLRVLVFFGVFTLLAFPQSSLADPIGCLRSAEGRNLIWNGSWQRDGQDQGVIYRVDRIRASYRSTKAFHVDLSTKKKAARSKRSVEVMSTYVASLLCSALTTERRTQNSPLRPRLPGLEKPKRSLPELGNAAAGLPFIRFGKSSWVRAEQPRGAELSICTILSRRFSCLLEEKTRYGSHLSSIAEEIRATR